MTPPQEPKTGTGTQQLDKQAHDILKYLHDCYPKSATLGEMASSFGLKPASAQYFIDILFGIGFVGHTSNFKELRTSGDVNGWIISKGGMAYIAAHGNA